MTEIIRVPSDAFGTRQQPRPGCRWFVFVQDRSERGTDRYRAISPSLWLPKLAVDRFGPDANQARFTIQILAREPQGLFTAEARIDQNRHGCMQFRFVFYRFQLGFDLLRVEKPNVVGRELPGTNAVHRILEAWIGIDQAVMLDGVTEQPVENFTVCVQSFWADHRRAVIQVTVDQRWIDLFGVFGHHTGRFRGFQLLRLPLNFPCQIVLFGGKFQGWRQRTKDHPQPGQIILNRLLPMVGAKVGDEILMSGLGASPTGDHPFIDKLNLATGKSTRVYQSDNKGYEVVEAVLNDSGTKLLTRRESPTDPPNYYVRTGADLKPLTHFTNPVPQTLKIKKELVNYKRADGVPLSFTLYLPPDYKPGTRLPAVVWAYPYEFSDVDTASQVTGHAAQSYTELNYHQLFVLHGYALIDNAAMPIIGDPDTVNNTYVEQLTMDAQAAVDKAVEMGVVDRDKVGVFGHSYGAFMTANLLAHTNIFHAGVAESGAYNRTLTPFGFQSEQRTFWQAQDVYTKMSPFWFADKIKTPILLIHGEADDNTGTFPIQSERLYAAVRGNGGTIRLVMLPNEAHGYRGKETMEHVLFEEMNWFDKYLK